MAEDNIGELMSNWSSMSMEDLGTSLLERKSTRDKEGRKAARKDERLAKAMGVLMAGQSIFAGSADKRIAELEQNAVFDKAQTQGQQPELQKVANIYGVMDSLEKTTGQVFTKDNYQQLLLDNKAFADQMKIETRDSLVDFFTKTGAKDLIDTDHFIATQEDLLPAMMERLIENRDPFIQNTLDLLDKPIVDSSGRTIEYDSAKLFEQVAGLTITDLDAIKVKKMLAEKQKIQQAGKNIFKFGKGSQYRNILSKWGLTDEAKGVPNIFANIENREDDWEVTLDNLNIGNIINKNINEIATSPLFQAQGFKIKGIKDTTTRETMTTMLDNLTASRHRKIGGKDYKWETEKTNPLFKGLRHRFGIGFLGKGRNTLWRFQSEITSPEFEAQKQDLISTASGLYQRLKDDRNFRNVFFDGKEYGQAEMQQAALEFTIREGVSFDYTYWNDQPDFKYNMDKIDRLLERSFTIDGGKFKGLESFKKQSKENQLERIQQEFNSIIKQTKLSSAQKKILTERLVLDINGAGIFQAFDPRFGLSNETLIQEFNQGKSIKDIMEDYSQLFETVNIWDTARPFKERRLRKDIKEADSTG